MVRNYHGCRIETTRSSNSTFQQNFERSRHKSAFNDDGTSAGTGRFALFVQCIQHRLQNLEAKQSAFLATGRQTNFQQIQHVLSLKVSQFLQRLPLDRLTQNRRRGLADGTSLAIKKGFFDHVMFIDKQFDSNLITTYRISIRVRAGRMRQMPLVIRGFKVIQDMVVVKIVVRSAHDQFSRFRSFRGSEF